MATPTPQEIWKILKETATQQRENTREIRANAKKTDEQIRELRANAKKTDEQIRELRANAKKTDEQIRELRASVKEVTAGLSRQVEKLTAGLKANGEHLGGLSRKWGDMGEALTIGDALPVFNAITGIAVDRLHHNIQGSRNGDSWEIDGIAAGDDTAIVIEAKADMSKGHVSEFIDRILKNFTVLEPDFAGKKIYGAIGYLKASHQAVTLAHRQGLLVIRSLHHSKELVPPPKGFKLRDFHP